MKMVSTKTIKVKKGSKLNWIVKSDGFIKQSGYFESINENMTYPVYLIGESNNTSKVTINPTPSDSKVVINEKIGKELNIVKGLTALYTVSADRYDTFTAETDRIYNDLEIPITLVGPYVYLTINCNKANATVMVNDVIGTEHRILKGSVVNYSITLSGYETINGTTEVLNEDTTLDFVMRKAPYDLKTTGEWTADVSSGNLSGFEITGTDYESWTMTPKRRALIHYAYVTTNYWNSSYYSRIDIHFKDGTSWLSDSQGSSTETVTNGTYPNFTCLYYNGTYDMTRRYSQWGYCNPYKEISKIAFRHAHYTNNYVSTDGKVQKLTGYWINALTINTNVPATITVDGVTKTDVTTYDFYTLDDEIDNTREIAYSIEAEGYMPQSGTLVLDKDVTLDIVLEELYPVTFTINPTPADATVIINGEERNTIEVMQLEEINWSVSCEGYYSQSDSFIIYEDILLEPKLDIEFNIWESSTPGTYQVELKAEGKYQIILVGAGGGGAGYGTKRKSAGGSGGYINGYFNLERGIYTFTVGKGGDGIYSPDNGYLQAGAGTSTTIRSNTCNMTANAGGGGYIYQYGSGCTITPGSGGSVSSVPSGILVELVASQSGNSGNGTTSDSYTVMRGGESLYNGYGKGGDAYCGTATEDGGNGYAMIKNIKD